MHRYPIKTAALLAKASYTALTHASVAPLIVNSLDDNDVQAHFLNNGILLIPGSNSLADYLKFNLRVMQFGTKRYRMSDDTTDQGASGTMWHQGFLAHAVEIWDWMVENNQRPTYIIGHSLGAAAAQVLTKSWGVPGIGFAAPRPRKHDGPLVNGKLCLCITRDTDIVCKLPGSFHHVGQVHKCRARDSKHRAGHKMKHYSKVITEQQKSGLLRKKWP